jgi:hypothetical protein
MSSATNGGDASTHAPTGSEQPGTKDAGTSHMTSSGSGGSGSGAAGTAAAVGTGGASSQGHAGSGGASGMHATGSGGSASSNDASVAHDAGSSSSSGVWRPFSDDSPWNTLIGDSPELDPNSTTLVTDFASSSPYGSHLDVNIAGNSIPLYYADTSTPTFDVVCDLGGLGFTGNNGSNAHATVPIPMGAMPDPKSDHHLLIVDMKKQIEWGMWNMQNQSGSWHCGLGATADLSGTGVRPYKPNNPTWYTSHGARACGYPLIAGLIRKDEIQAGTIEHALVVAYPHIRAGFYTYPPASTAQAKMGTDSISTRGIPCGGRIQFDPSIDRGSLGLRPAGKAIIDALQRYGAYVGDYSGAISLYAEGDPDAQSYFSNTLDSYELMGKIDLNSFRVLKIGQLTDDGNGG